MTDKTRSESQRSPRTKRRSLDAENHSDGRDEAGAVLVLALLFVLVVGAVVGSIATWATNDLNNTAKFTSARTLQYAFNGATEVAVQNIRYTPLLATTVPGPASCWSGSSTVTIDNQNIDVWCSTTYNPTSPSTRVVTLNACLHGVSATTCAANTSNPTLQAVVTFDDYPTGTNPPNPAACVVYCGTSMTVNSWVWSS